MRRKSASSRAPPSGKDRFDQRNRFVTKNEPKVVKQVYRVKRDCNLRKNSDLTQVNEKPTISEVSASSSDSDVPNEDHVSSIRAEQTSSSAGGQDTAKAEESARAGLSGSKHRTVRCTSPDCPVPVTGLSGGSRVHGGGSKTELKRKPSFSELLAKYEREGAAKKKIRSESGATSRSSRADEGQQARV